MTIRKKNMAATTHGAQWMGASDLRSKARRGTPKRDAGSWPKNDDSGAASKK
jgi:hypothetical protein